MRALWIASGVLVWALHFGVVYGFTALACARGMAPAVPWVAGGATIVAGLVAAGIVLTHLSSDFIRWMTAAIAGFALLAILWEGLAALLVKPCA